MAARFRVLALLLLLVVPTAPPAAGETGSVDVAGFEMTSPVRQQLRRVQEAWQRWTGTWYQGDRDQAAVVLEEILSVVHYLGMERAPDLAAAAASYAIQAARAGDEDKARWALETAAALDDSSPELSLARAEVARAGGDWIGWVRYRLEAFGARGESTEHHAVRRANAILWGAYTLLLAGALFVAVQMASKGPRVLSMVGGVLGGLQGPVAVLAGIAALLWPVVLPNGVMWLLLYWVVLLWTWCALQERVVFALSLLALGLTPIALDVEEQHVQLASSPPVRVLDSLEQGRLYGALFSDLGVLQTLLPESAAVQEVVADLHRRFGQWEHARSVYQNLLEDQGADIADAAPVLNNLAVYHFEKEDFGTAIQLLRDSSELRPTAEALYNLSQSYSKSYNFERAHEALAEAKGVDAGAVEQWLGTSGDDVEPSDVVGIDGGLQKRDDIMRDLARVWTPSSELPSVEFWRRHLSLGAVALALLLAVAVDVARRRWTLEDLDVPDGAAGRMTGLVPGLPSADDGRGIGAYLGILLPVALALPLIMRTSGYRAPLACDPGVGLVQPLAVLGLLALFTVRLVLMRRQG